jgi:hypothetical protein
MTQRPITVYQIPKLIWGADVWDWIYLYHFTMAFPIAGKNAIVTGAASGAIPVPFLVLSFTEYNHLLSFVSSIFTCWTILGINLAFATLLAEKGANVVVADVQETKDLQELLGGKW